jgi:hypothetical protein
MSTTLKRTVALYLTCFSLKEQAEQSKACAQTEFVVYRHRPHGFSDILKNFRFQIKYSNYMAPLPRPLERCD